MRRFRKPKNTGQYRVEAPISVLTGMRKFKDKKGSGCAMCKPHKHGWADKRTLQEKRKDVDTSQQLTDTLRSTSSGARSS